MPRLAPLVVVGFFNVSVGAGCWFSADYRSGNVACHDGKCPSGLTCVADVCVAATGDGPGSNVHDARVTDAKLDAPAQMAALTCADPGSFVADNTVSGTTVGRANTISASCNGTVMTGNDAVYKIAGVVGEHVVLTPHSSEFSIVAYVITPCATTGVPVCTGNAYATDTAPITIILPTMDDYFIVVDSGLAAAKGAYTLTVALN